MVTGKNLFQDPDTKNLVKFLNAHRQVKHEDGYKKYRNIVKFRSAFSGYRLNYLSYIKYNSHFLSNYDSFKFDTIKRWRKQRVIVKDLNNLITSSQYYLSQINRLAKNLDLHVYNFNADPLHIFFNTLRDYIAHRHYFELVTVSSRTRNADGSTLEINYQSMSRKEFGDYVDNMHSGKKNQTFDKKVELTKFLDTLTEKINIDNLLDGYHLSLLKFQADIISDYVNLHRESLVKLYTGNIYLKNFESKYKIPLPLHEVESRYLNYLVMRAE